MRKAHITGNYKDSKVKKYVDTEGYMQGNFFYPDKNNATLFYVVSYCHRNWKYGILIKHIEDIEDDD